MHYNQWYQFMTNDKIEPKMTTLYDRQQPSNAHHGERGMDESV